MDRPGPLDSRRIGDNKLVPITVAGPGPCPGPFTLLRGRPLLFWSAVTRPGAGRPPGDVRLGAAGLPRVAPADGALALTRSAFADDGPTLNDGDRLGPALGDVLA